MLRFLLKITLVLGLVVFSFTPLFALKTSAAVTVFPFGGRVISIILPLTPPLIYCPCFQYYINYVNVVVPALPMLLCPWMPQTIPLINPSPVVGDWTLGLAIPNILMPTCLPSYLPIMWGASLTP